MGLLIDPEVRGRIFALADENLSSPAILKRLKKQNVKVSERTIRRVLQNRRQTQEAGGNAPQQLRTKGLTFGELRPMLQKSRTLWIKMIRCPKMRLDDV